MEVTEQQVKDYQDEYLKVQAQLTEKAQQLAEANRQLQNASVRVSELWAQLHEKEQAVRNAIQSSVNFASVLADTLNAWRRNAGGAEYTPEWKVAEELLKSSGLIRTELVLNRVLELTTALKVYANPSMWVLYERDGETTASIFIADENGNECGVLSHGYLLAQAALKGR
jgi:septal ring factor EnvC (AmiA/AmiB activator)